MDLSYGPVSPELSPFVSPVFICSSGDLVVHLLQGRRGGISRSEVVSLLSTHSIDPCLWGESDHPAFGPPASLSLHLASSSITPAGSVHKSMGDSVVRMWVQLKRWCVSCVWVLHRGHSGDWM